jgi:chemotaxis protein histidine kinase CheA
MKSDKDKDFIVLQFPNHREATTMREVCLNLHHTTSTSSSILPKLKYKPKQPPKPQQKPKRRRVDETSSEEDEDEDTEENEPDKKEDPHEDLRTKLETLQNEMKMVLEHVAMGSSSTKSSVPQATMTTTTTTIQYPHLDEVLELVNNELKNPTTKIYQIFHTGMHPTLFKLHNSFKELVEDVAQKLQKQIPHTSVFFVYTEWFTTEFDFS